MQYAYMPIGRERVMHVLDACELFHLDTAVDGKPVVKDDPPPPDEGCHHLVYGAFLPNKDTTVEKSREYLKYAVGHVLQVSRPKRISFLGLEGIWLGGLVVRGRSWRLPVAALVTGSMEFARDKTAFGKTAYLHYANLSVVENILTRPGVLSLKTAERRYPGSIRAGNWQEFVDEKRMYATAVAVAG